MRVHVDRDLCSGHGRCAAVAPDVFDVDDLGNAVVLVEHIGPDLERQAREAVLTCPERCISITDD